MGVSGTEQFARADPGAGLTGEHYNRVPVVLMKRSSAALIILAIVAASCQRAQEAQQTGVTVAAEPAKRSVTTDAELASYVDTLADRLTREDQFSGVVLLARMGQPILRKGYGLADRDTKRPNTPETSFALGSVSKMFTAVLVARMIEQGRISPADDRFAAQ